MLELPGQPRALAAGVGDVGALRRDLEEEDRELRRASDGEERGAEGSRAAGAAPSRVEQRWPWTAGTRSAARAGAE